MEIDAVGAGDLCRDSQGNQFARLGIERSLFATQYRLCLKPGIERIPGVGVRVERRAVLASGRFCPVPRLWRR